MKNASVVVIGLWLLTQAVSAQAPQPVVQRRAAILTRAEDGKGGRDRVDEKTAVLFLMSDGTVRWGGQ